MLEQQFVITHGKEGLLNNYFAFLHFKILQARLQQYENHEFQDIQARFRKRKGSRDQIASIHWIIEKARAFQKNIYFCFIDYTEDFDCVDQKNCGNFLKRCEYKTTWPAFWEICMQIKK